MSSRELKPQREETRNLQGVSVHGGFPNPASESPLENPDFNRLLIRHPAATYCMRIKGHNWEDRGIFDGDIAVIDRAIDMRPKDLVVWWQDEGFIIGRLKQAPARTDIWGAVKAVIHIYKP